VDQAGFGCADAFLAQFVNLETGIRQLDDEQADRLGGELRAGTGGDEEEIGDRGIRDVELAAVQYPSALDTLRPGLERADVRAAVGFAQPETCDLLARQRWLEEPGPLLGRARLPDRPDSQVSMGRPARRERLAHVAELFAHDAVADLVEPAAAVRFRIAHAEQAQLAPASENLSREHLGFLGIGDQTGEFVTAEPPDGVAHRIVFGSEAEVEAHSLTAGSVVWASRSRWRSRLIFALANGVLSRKFYL